MKRVCYEHDLVKVGVILLAGTTQYRVVEFLHKGNGYVGDRYKLVAETGVNKGNEYVYDLPKFIMPNTPFFLLLPEEDLPLLEDML